MKSGWIQARQTRFTAYVTIYTIIVIAALVMLNWLANRHNKSFDSTANKRFSLSDQTTKVVGDLKSDARIYYFDRGDSFGRARDLLDRYDNLSTKLAVNYVDPDKKPQMARSYGVESLGTVIVETGTRREQAKSLTEEEITGALIRTLKTGDRWVCAVGGSGEHSFDDTERTGFSGLKQALEKGNFKTRTISLLEKPEVPQDCTILLIGGPRFDYVQPVVDAIGAFADRGGDILVMVDAPVRTAKESVAENAPLTALVASWGVTLNKDLVVDLSGVGRMVGMSELVTLITDYESHAIVRPFKNVATGFPMPRSMETASPAEKVINTTAASLATSKLELSGQLAINPDNEKKGPFTIAAAGTLPSKARYVVVGSSGFAANNMLGFYGNSDLALNMFSWLSADEDLISIRPRDPEDRRLSISRGQLPTIFVTSVVLMPLAVILAGVSVWWKRR